MPLEAKRRLLVTLLFCLSPVGIIVPFVFFGNIICDIVSIPSSIPEAVSCVTPGLAPYYNFVTTLFYAGMYMLFSLAWFPFALYLWYALIRQISTHFTATNSSQ